MLIALPVAAIIVVLLRHARECYEKSRIYGQPQVVIQNADIGSVSIESEQVDVDVELKDQPVKNLQDAEKSSKIGLIDNKESEG